jgi:kinesin family protein C1
MQEMHDKLQDYSTSLQGFNSKLQADVDRMNSALQEVSAELAVVQGENAAVKSQLEQTASILDASNAKASAVCSQKAAARNNQQQLEQSVETVMQNLESETKRRTDLTTELETLSNACWSTGEEYEALKIEMQQLEAEASAQAVVLDQVQRELEVHRARMKLVDDSALERGRSLQAMEERLAESNATAAKLEETIAQGEVCRKQLHNTILEMKGNIRVFCRVRPLTATEAAVGTPIEIPASEPADDSEEENANRVIQLQFERANDGRKQDHSFTFDKIFAPSSTQQEVFGEISQLVQSALDGYKVCVFAYGQTGSGKTYTMVGGDGLNRGMIPLSVEQVLQRACIDL